MHNSRYLSARDFFAALKWDYSTDTNTAVYLQPEITGLPLKWLKYLLLERTGLTSMSELQRTIHRYSVWEMPQARECCQSLLGTLASRRTSMVVVKVVYFDKAGQLPNFRIHTHHELTETFDKHLRRYLATAYEIWLCKSSIDTLGVNLGGRIAFSIDQDYAPTLLEIVWYSSPRSIEQFRSQGFAYPYLRAHKLPGSLQHAVDTLYVPELFAKEVEIRQRLLSEAQFVVESLHDLEEPQERLVRILQGAGAHELSIEFKVSNGNFSVIDWDTEIETVL